MAKVGEGRIVSLFDETTRLLPKIVEGLKKIAESGIQNVLKFVDDLVYRSDLTEYTDGYGQLPTDLNDLKNGLPNDFLRWIEDNFSAGEFIDWTGGEGSPNYYAGDIADIVNKIETMLGQAPPPESRTENAQIQWLRGVEEGLGKDLDSSGLDEENQKQWDTWTPPAPIVVPDTTTQPGEEDMPLSLIHISEPTRPY